MPLPYVRPIKYHLTTYLCDSNSLDTMRSLQLIKATTAYRTGMDTGAVEQVSLAALFHDDSDVVRCVVSNDNLCTITNARDTGASNNSPLLRTLDYSLTLPLSQTTQYSMLDPTKPRSCMAQVATVPAYSSLLGESLIAHCFLERDRIKYVSDHPTLPGATL